MGESAGGLPRLGRHRHRGAGRTEAEVETALEEVVRLLHSPTHSRTWTESKLPTLCAAPLPPSSPLQLSSGLLTCPVHLPPPVIPESFAQCPPPALNALCSGWPRVWSARLEHAPSMAQGPLP